MEDVEANAYSRYASHGKHIKRIAYCGHPHVIAIFHLKEHERFQLIHDLIRWIDSFRMLTLLCSKVLCSHLF